MDNICGIIIVLALIIIIYNKINYEGFSVGREEMYEKINTNKGLFASEQYNELKSKLNWMDAGIYMDVRDLLRRNVELNPENLSIIFRKNVI